MERSPPAASGPLRIGVLLDRWSADGGGLEAWLGAVAPVWAARGHEVLLIARDASRRPPEGVVPIGAGTPWPVPRPWRDGLDARARVAAARHAAVAVALDLRAAACPGAVWFAMGGFGAARATDAPSWRRRALLRLEHASVRRAAAVIAPSEMVAAAVRAFAPALPVHLLPLPLLADVPNAAGPDDAALAGRRPLRVFFCGRDPRRHGLDAALAWFAALRARLPLAELEVWSRGRAHGAGVVAHGWNGGFRAALARADLLLHPTAYDSFSLACLEAAAAGVPVLTTARAGAAACLPAALCATAERADPGAAAQRALMLLRAAASLSPEARAAECRRLRAQHDLTAHADRLAAILALHRWTS